jgi:hypothetical protein
MYGDAVFFSETEHTIVTVRFESCESQPVFSYWTRLFMGKTGLCLNVVIFLGERTRICNHLRGRVLRAAERMHSGRRRHRGSRKYGWRGGCGRCSLTDARGYWDNIH